MYQTNTFFEKLKQLFYLLIPILITQLGMYAMVFFNIIMTGKYDSAELAGVAIGSSIWNPIFTWTKRDSFCRVSDCGSTIR